LLNLDFDDGGDDVVTGNQYSSISLQNQTDGIWTDSSAAPEPSTSELASLGGVILLIVLRLKQKQRGPA
jgi:hypothetical protein